MELSLTQEEFAKPLNLAWFQVKDMESGRKRLTPQLFELLEQKYAINMRWLISGNEPMMLNVEHITSNALCPSSGTDISKDDIVNVSLSAITACCGVGITTYPTEFLDEKIVVNKKHIGKIDSDRPPYAVQTSGRSMAGYGVEEESIVIINPAEDIHTGHIVLAVIDEKATIKKLYERSGGIDLVSSNGDKVHFTPEDLSDTYYVRIMGRVMLVISPPNEGV